MRCERCDRELKIGDWPWCKGNPNDHTPPDRFGFDPLTAYWDEHITKEGAWIETRGDRMKLMRENGLEYRKQPKPRGQIYVDLGRK